MELMVKSLGASMTVCAAVLSITGWLLGTGNDIKYEQLTCAIWATSCTCAWLLAGIISRKTRLKDG